jgi:hypothetical protein
MARGSFDTAADRTRRRTQFNDTATVPYPLGVPTWIDDDTTVRIDEREMSLTAEATMFIDSALMPVVRTRH